MKKLIVTSLVIFSIVSCNKKETPVAEKTTSDPSVDSTKTEIPAITIAEWNTEKVAALVTPKQNDTLYITNFFATWCGPCMKEIPHFKEKMEEMKNEKVKFTFVFILIRNGFNLSE